MLKKILMCGALALAGCAHKPVTHVPETQVTVVPPVPVPPRAVTWREFTPGTKKLAERQGKITLLFFYDNSETAQEMKRTVFTDPCVVNMIEDNFILVGVDVDRVKQASVFLDDKGIKVPAVMYVIPREGFLPISSGYLPPAAYCKILTGLEKVRQQAMKNHSSEE